MVILNRIFVLATVSLLGWQSSAADDALSRLKARAAQNTRWIEQIAAKDTPNQEDLNKLMEFIHSSGTPWVEVPSDRLVAPARKAFARIAESHPELFAQLLREHEDKFRTFPHTVADLIFTAAAGAPSILRLLHSAGLLSGQAIQRALARETGYYPVNLGLTGSGRVNSDVLESNLEAQLPDTLNTAIALFDAGVRSDTIVEILTEAARSERLSTAMKISAIQRLGLSGTKDPRAVHALLSVVMPPISITGTVAEMHSLRLSAVSAIGGIALQESVDALWAIEGLDTSRTQEVILRARQARESLMNQGVFRQPSLSSRLLRALGCERLFSGFN